MSIFSNIAEAPPNSVLGLALECKLDTFTEKVNLTVGAYRDEEGKSVTLPSIREAEKRVYEANEGHEYLTQDGLEAFTKCAQGLFFGEDSDVLKENRCYTIQAISGTGAIRLGADFISTHLKGREVFIPDTTWANHRALFEAAGCAVGTYKYLNDAGLGLDFEGFLGSLRTLPSGSVVLLQLCAQNPTGVDPTMDQWVSVMEVVKEKCLVTFWDSAYQGFVSGDPYVDGAPLGLWTQAGLPMFAAQSFSKIFGLYGERTGALHVVAESSGLLTAIASQLRVLSRANYSTCPAYGARLVSTILSDPGLKATWLKDCKNIADRIRGVRYVEAD